MGDEISKNLKNAINKANNDWKSGKEPSKYPGENGGWVSTFDQIYLNDVIGEGVHDNQTPEPQVKLLDSTTRKVMEESILKDLRTIENERLKSEQVVPPKSPKEMAGSIVKSLKEHSHLPKKIAPIVKPANHAEKIKQERAKGHSEGMGGPG